MSSMGLLTSIMSKEVRGGSGLVTSSLTELAHGHKGRMAEVKASGSVAPEGPRF